MYSITVNWQYKPRFYFPYGGTSYYFPHGMKVLGKIIDASDMLDMSLSIADIYLLIQYKVDDSTIIKHLNTLTLFPIFRPNKI